MHDSETDFSSIPSPCYVLEEDLLHRNLQLIAGVAKDAGVSIIPALKGFAMWSVFPLLGETVSGASASSLNEARLISEEMGLRAHTYAPVFREADFEEILACSSHVTFNSGAQARRYLLQLDRHNQTAGRQVSWGVRVNPGYSPVETALYNPAAPESRLGMSREELDELYEAFQPDGLHVHALCESSAESSARLIAVVDENFGDLFSRLRWLNLGGGHLMTRSGYERQVLIDALSGLKRKYPRLEIILEPGSAFAWGTGFLRASVEDIVVRGGRTTAILDVSFTAHMPDCLEMPYRPRIRGARIAGESDAAAPGEFRCRMGGNSCLAGDVMGDWIFPSPLSVGDTIIFEDMIHYTMVKTTMFNGVHHPSIGILKADGSFQLVREFGYPDYRDRLS